VRRRGLAGFSDVFGSWRRRDGEDPPIVELKRRTKGIFGQLEGFGDGLGLISDPRRRVAGSCSRLQFCRVDRGVACGLSSLGKTQGPFEGLGDGLARSGKVGLLEFIGLVLAASTTQLADEPRQPESMQMQWGA
jgi:hypothetical protein